MEEVVVMASLATRQCSGGRQSYVTLSLQSFSGLQKTDVEVLFTAIETRQCFFPSC